MPSGKASRVALGAMFAACALMLSFVETVVPVAAVVPLPGFKLGLANIAVMAALYYCGRVDALLVALIKISVTALLFTNAMSFAFSLCGTLLSLSVLIAFTYLPKCPFSFIGLSVLSALGHNVGQIIVACLWFGSAAVSFLPYLLIVSLLSGIITGILLCSLSPVLDRLVSDKGK